MVLAHLHMIKLKRELERIPLLSGKIVADYICIFIYLFTSTEYSLCHTLWVCLHKDSAYNTLNILVR